MRCYIARHLVRIALYSCLLTLSSLCYSQSLDDVCEPAPFEDLECEPDLYRIEAAQKVEAFASSLKGALVKAIQQQGFAHAVDVCKSQAPEIASALSTDGWTVARTSLKARNPKNKPDGWEKGILEDFDHRFKAGIPVSALAAEIREKDQYRFMQAIPTSQVCLACHGSAIESELADTIRSQYPQDAATGYTLEDIRGAFTLRKVLN